MSVVFEDLVDDLRSGQLDDSGQRRLTMVLRSQTSAAMDLALLDLFDSERDLTDADYDSEAITTAVFARLDEEARETSGVMETSARLPFDPLPAPSPAALAAGAEPTPAPTVPVSRKALGRPMLAKPLTTTQKLAVQLARRPFLRPWLAAAVVLLSLSMGWTARGLVADPVPAAPLVKAPVQVEGDGATRTLGADDLLAFAENAVGRDQHRRAARLYQELLRRFPRSHEAGMAQLGLARLQLEVFDQPDEAATSYGAFLESNPEDDLAPDAALGRARALEAAGSREAPAAWREIESRFPGSAAASASRRHR